MSLSGWMISTYIRPDMTVIFLLIYKLKAVIIPFEHISALHPVSEDA